MPIKTSQSGSFLPQSINFNSILYLFFVIAFIAVSIKSVQYLKKEKERKAEEARINKEKDKLINIIDYIIKNPDEFNKKNLRTKLQEISIPSTPEPAPSSTHIIKIHTSRGFYKISAIFFLAIIIFLIFTTFNNTQKIAIPSVFNPVSQIPVTAPIATSSLHTTTPTSSLIYMGEKNLEIGETWDVGGGYAISAQSIDAKANPRLVWLVLSNNDHKLTDGVYKEGDVFSYNNIFSTKIYRILAGATTDMVKLTDTYITSSESIPSQTNIPTTFTNSIGMEFVQIPAGEFDMGSAVDEKYTIGGAVYPVSRFDQEGPVHRVKISKNFYIGKYEVTQKQWVEVMGSNPSDFKGNDLPVVQVSWNDVQDFIIKLNQKEGTTKYRLPSEAEWEYAARAGTNTIWSFGNDATNLEEYIVDAGDRTARPGAPCVVQQVCPTARPVGQKKPNQWGLYDMIGNVYEWVQDKYHINYNGAPSDGSAWESGNDPDLRVIKGGSWSNGIEVVRPAFRSGLIPYIRGNSFGFRLVVDLPVPKVTTAVIQNPNIISTVSPTPITTSFPPINSPTPTGTIIKPGVFFEGTFNQFNYGTYPMIMEIKTVNGLEFDGILHWPTLGDSKTKFRGNIDSGSYQIWFTEYELIQGSSTIVLNGNYYAELKDSTLSGYWNWPSGVKGGTFSMTPSSLASKSLSEN